MEDFQVLRVKNSDQIIAVCGCTHGELNLIYSTLQSWESSSNKKISFILCCGDFEAVRDDFDLNCMSVPPKYRKMKDFCKYYCGKKVAPYLTIFVGGNHEAMNYLHDLYYGGWVAENIYFMGYSGVININGLRIAGVSGIHNFSDWKKGYYETYPYEHGEIKSAFHTRQYEIMKLSLIKDPIDIFVSHDWPTIIGDLSDFKILTKIKPHFKDDLKNSVLGSPNLSALLDSLKPRFWFSAHLHVHWEVTVDHRDKYDDIISKTYFVSLDKPIINRGYMDICAISLSSKVKNKAHDQLKRIYTTNRYKSQTLPQIEYVEDSVSESESNNIPSDSDTDSENEIEFVNEEEQKVDIKPEGETIDEELEEELMKEEAKEDKTTFSQEGIHFDKEWLAILKTTHDLMPLDFKKYNFEEYIHPMQIGHQDIVIAKEECYKKLDIKDFKAKPLTNEEIYTTWNNDVKMNTQSIQFIEMLGVDNRFFRKQINKWNQQSNTVNYEENKQQTFAQPDSNEISLDF